MTGQRPSQVSPASAAPDARRPGRVAGAAALMLAAVLVLLVAQDWIALHYVTPPVRPGSTVQQRSIVWGPGVVAAVVALLAVLSCMGWLILNWVTRPPRRFWWLVAGLVVLAGVWTAATITLDTPKF